MKTFIAAFTLTLAVGFVSTAPTIAQTPDGQTPAEEMVCDPLKADGVTKGLYGLCVAFCEAQDHATFDETVTEAELDALISGIPSGRILTNYNKKKQVTDPSMPCIVVDDGDESCPCWSAEELADIDGFALIGDPPVETMLPAFCLSLSGTGIFAQQLAGAGPLISIPGVFCLYQDSSVIPNIFRPLGVAAGTLTVIQANNCFAQLQAHCLNVLNDVVP
jgi:hypothetical protein